MIWGVSFWKFVRGLFPGNGRLHHHFGNHFLNFDARSILSMWKDGKFTKFLLFQLKTVITFKQEIFSKLIQVFVDVPIQCASFYVERIDLASKLRKWLPKWWWSRPFPGKKSPYIFSETDPSNQIISTFYTFWATFFTTKKQTNNLFHLILYFKHHHISELSLNICTPKIEWRITHFTHFEQPFSLQKNKKQPISPH